MTIALAWIGTRTDGREDLYFATDSRTRGSMVTDHCPKILTLPRSDCAISFAGDVLAAYPLMLQISYAIEAHGPARDRNLDIVELKSHILRICTDLVNNITDVAVPFAKSDAQFIFGGYSWRSKSFRLWTIYYEPKLKKFSARESVAFHKRLIKAAFIGDWATRCRRNLIAELVGQDPENILPSYLEPLTVLAKLIKSGTKDDTIGGAPQLVKIGPHMNSRPYCVKWGDKKTPHLFGRPLFDYENCDFWSIDPETTQIEQPRHFKLD